MDTTDSPHPSRRVGNRAFQSVLSGFDSTSSSCLVIVVLVVLWYHDRGLMDTTSWGTP